MRSRFSAYCIEDYHYILATYGKVQRSRLSLAELQESSKDSQWLGLSVVDSRSLTDTTASVEFIATYIHNKAVYQMHEVSMFELQDNQWRYTTGEIQQNTGKIKLSRNAPCPCHSGKKFKQCCMKKGQ